MFTLNKHFTTVKSRKFLTAILIAVLVFAPYFSLKTSAVPVGDMVRFDNITTSTPTTGTVCFSPLSTGTLTSVAVTFPSTTGSPASPSTFTLTGPASNFTVNNTSNVSWPSGATAATITSPASTFTAPTVTWTLSGTYTAGTLYCFNWTNSASISTGSVASPSNIGSIALSNGNTAQWATPTVANDQIVVSATVNAIFSFALSGNTDSLGTLSTGSITTSGTPRTATVSTNATNGWGVWAKDYYYGLCSPTIGTCTQGSNTAQINSRTPGTNSTLTAGTIGMNLGLPTPTKVNGALPTVDPAFVGTSSGQGGGLDSSFRSLATASGPSDTAVLTLKNNVTIDGTIRAAADYSDTITIMGAGLF
jgi:hypothetical protein